MANQWFKFYGAEFLGDPKIFGLSASERSCWITLLCLASTSTDPGKIPFLSEDQLMLMSGIDFQKDEWEDTKGVLKNFERLKMIVIEENSVFLPNYGKRQMGSLTEAERKALQRKNKRENDDVRTLSGQVSGQVSGENRIEENRIDKKRVFAPPSFDEVKNYCDERQNKIDPQSFIDFYESKGWFVGKNKMKDWRAAVRTWESRGSQKGQEKKLFFRGSPARIHFGTYQVFSNGNWLNLDPKFIKEITEK